jgi:hypothetical protein
VCARRRHEAQAGEQCMHIHNALSERQVLRCRCCSRLLCLHHHEKLACSLLLALGFLQQFLHPCGRSEASCCQCREESAQHSHG